METRYIYDAAGNLLAETNSAGAVSRYYIHGLGLLAAVTPAGAVSCYHYDGVGSTVAITDSSQAVVNAYAYDPFGNILSQNEAFAQPFKYVGKLGVMAEPNGFYYMRARYYDPAAGRFISEDPLGFDGGDVNLYVYAGNNPVNRVDPLGLKLKVPNLTMAYPNSTFVAPVTQIVVGANEVAFGLTSGVAGVLLIAMGPETWLLAQPFLASSPTLVFDGVNRIQDGVSALENRNSQSSAVVNNLNQQSHPQLNEQSATNHRGK